MKKSLKLSIITICFIVIILLLFCFFFRIKINIDYDFYEFSLENKLSNNLVNVTGKVDNTKGLIYTKKDDKEYYNIKAGNAYYTFIDLSDKTHKAYSHLDRDYESIDINKILLTIKNKVSNNRYFVNSSFKVDLTSEEFIDLSHIAYAYEADKTQINIDSSSPYCEVSLDYNKVKSIKCVSNNNYFKLTLSNIDNNFETNKDNLVSTIDKLDLVYNPNSYVVTISNLSEEIKLNTIVNNDTINFVKDNVNYEVKYDKDNSKEYLVNVDTNQSTLLDSNYLLKDLYELMYKIYSEDGFLYKTKTLRVNMNDIYNTINKVLDNKYDEVNSHVNCKFNRSGNVLVLVNCDNGLSINFDKFNSLK